MPRYVHVIIVKNTPEKGKDSGVFVSPAFEVSDDEAAQNKAVEMNVDLIKLSLFKYFESQVFKEVGDNAEPAGEKEAFFDLKDGCRYTPVDRYEYLPTTRLFNPVED